MNLGKRQILLVNMGGIRGKWDAVSFLFRMFQDRNILFVDQPLRTVMALLFTAFRAKSVLSSNFSTPIFDISRLQAESLGKLTGACVDVRYVYSRPLLKGRVGDRRIVAMYPFYSHTTHGRIMELARFVAPPLCIFQEYVDMVVSRINNALSECGEGSAVLLSAHSIPLKTANKRRDPYRGDLEAFRRLLSSLLGRTVFLSFQSRFGGIEWLSPSTEDMLKCIARHYSGVVILPVSFVAENSETVEEIDVKYKSLSEKLGIRCFKRVPCFNNDPDFIDLLRRIVE